MARFSVAGMRTPPQVYAWSRFGEPEYTTWLDEELSWKENCYIGDWSFLWQHHFRGPDVLRLFSDITVNTYKSFVVGQSKHAIHTNRDGRVIHEGILTRYSDDDFVLHGRGGFWAKYSAERGKYNVSVERDDWFIYQVSGPNAVKVLRKLDSSDAMLSTRFMWVTPLTIAGHKVWALRQGMSGEVGFELQGPVEHGREVYEAVLAAGQEFGIRRMGARVAMINHLEAAYPTIATDYIPAIFDDDMAEYLEVFLSSMPSFAQQQRVSAIARTAAKVAMRDSAESVLSAMAVEIRQTEGIAGAQIILVDSVTGSMRMMGSAGFSEDDGFFDLLMACHRRGAPLATYEALRTGAQRLYPDRKAEMLADDRWQPLHAYISELDWHDFIATPFRLEGVTSGVINAYVSQSAGHGSAVREFLKSMADQAALTLDYHALIDRDRRKIRQEERRRLAHELHDSAIQHVFTLGMYARTLESVLADAGAGPAAAKLTTEMQELVRVVQRDLRGIVRTLRPSPAAVSVHGRGQNAASCAAAAARPGDHFLKPDVTSLKLRLGSVVASRS